MKSRKIALPLCVLALLAGNQTVFGAEPPKGKGGPIFTIPKTVVILDMQVDKVVQSPGVYCEFLDLFFPGMDPSVPCNGSVLPALELRKIDQTAGTVEMIDEVLIKKSNSERLALLKEKRASAKLKENQLEETSRRVAEIEKLPSSPEKADRLEKPLKQAVESASIDLAAKEDYRTKMADGKKAKEEAKTRKMSLKDFRASLDADVAAALKKLDEALAKLRVAAPEIARFRKPLSEACPGGESLKACDDLAAAKRAVEQARKEADFEADGVARLDRRPPHTVSITRLKNFAVSTRGVPDPDYVQDLPYASGFFKDSEQTFDIEPGGILQGIKSTTTDHAAEVFFSVLKAASGIAGRVLTGAGSAPPNALNKTKTGEDEFADFLKKDAPEAGPILEANFRMLSKGRRTQYVRGWKDLPEVLAALFVAKRSYLGMSDLETKYSTMLGGTSSQPGITAVLEANRKSFDALLSQGWTGSSQVLSWTPTYEVTPAKPSQAASGAAKDPDRLADGQTLLLFRLATVCGVDSTGADVLPVRVPQPRNMGCGARDPEDEKPEFRDITLAVAKATEPTVSSKARDLPTQPRENEGLPFVVPADAVVKVANTGIRLVDPHVLLAQGGFVAHLPVSLFNGTGGVEATYYQATGALKSIKQKTSAKLTGAQVEAVGSAILGPLDAKLTANAKEEAAAKAASADTKAAADELLKWKRITDTLNARKSAEALCREFGISPCQ